MNHLLYASDEMFSSTQLVRKSKDIFDKLTSNKINKAVILRDGKPNFMLLDFHKYEELMKEYQELKLKSCEYIHINKQKDVKIENSEPIELKLDFSDVINDEIEEEQIENIVEDTNDDDIAQAELAKALAQIEALDLDPELKNEAREKLKENSTAQIKEFWN